MHIALDGDSSVYMALKLTIFAFLAYYYTSNMRTLDPEVQSKWNHLIYTRLAAI